MLQCVYSGQVIKMQFCIPPGSQSTVAVLNGPLTVMSIYIPITKEVTAVRSEGLIF